jgi:hypothetical protein
VHFLFSSRLCCYIAGFEALTVVVVKSSVFWDMRPYSPFSANGRFRGSYLLSLQGQRIIQARNQREASSDIYFMLVSCFDAVKYKVLTSKQCECRNAGVTNMAPSQKD